MGNSFTPGSGVTGDAVGLASITIMVLSPILMCVVSGTTCAREKSLHVVINKQTKPKRMMGCFISKAIIA